MRAQSKFAGVVAVLIAVFLALPVVAQEKKSPEKKAEEKKVEKAKAEKVAGDIGLLDTEKNYMIVTKEGKLVTLDYTQKTKVTELKSTTVKMSDVGLGSSAAVEYIQKGDKNFLSKIEFKGAKGE
jgi:hypothetical protein